MAGIPVAVREKLKPLILLLASEFAGEREAAAAAIARTLKANNLDFHDLASGLTSEPPPASPPEPPAAPPFEPRLSEREDGRFDIPNSDVLTIIEAIRGSFIPDARSADFLNSLEGRANDWSIVILSPKQLSWLTSLMGMVR